MEYLNKPAKVLAGYLSERSTIRTMYSPDIPDIKHGKEKFIAKKGDRVKASGTGMFKAGTPITIKDTYTQNGYCYYVDTAGNTHRNKDIIK